MGRETANTGGIHEIHITKEDRKKWEREDTESTREFKDALHKWRKDKIHNQPKPYSQKYIKSSENTSQNYIYENEYAPANKDRNKEIGNSGGEYEFHITKEDRKKWETEDTKSTLAFKEALHKWHGSPKFKLQNVLWKVKKKLNQMGWILGIILIIIFIYLLKNNGI